jgi:hypothetical protein
MPAHFKTLENRGVLILHPDSWRERPWTIHTVRGQKVLRLDTSDMTLRAIRANVLTKRATLSSRPNHNTVTCSSTTPVSIYSSAPISGGNTFQDLPQLCETADNTKHYI